MNFKKISALIILCVISLSGKADDWKEKLVRQGIYKYRQLEKFNTDNAATGKSHLNQYVIELSDNWVEERSNKVILSKNYESLSNQLREFNNNRKDGLRFYIIVVNDYEVQLNETVDFSKDLPDRIDNLTSYVNLPSTNVQYERFTNEIASIPDQILAEMTAKKYDERIVYFYARIKLYKLGGDKKTYKYDRLSPKGGRLDQAASEITIKARSGLGSKDAVGDKIQKIALNIINAVRVVIDGEGNTPSVNCNQSLTDIATSTAPIKEKEYSNIVKSFASLVDNPSAGQQIKSRYVLVNAPGDFSSDNTFTSEILPDKVSLLANNSGYKLYVVFKEINFALTSTEWAKLAQDVYNQSTIGKQSNVILMVVPYLQTQCNGTNWLGLTVSRGTGLIMPAVYCGNNSLTGLMNSALSLTGIGWEAGFNQAFSHIPKNYTTYDYKLLWNGDLIYDGVEKYENVTGNDDVIDVRLLVDERFHQLRDASFNFSTCNSGTVGGIPGSGYANTDAQNSCLTTYDNTVNAILSSRPDFRVVKKTNLVQSRLTESVAQQFAQWYAKRKNWGVVAYFSSPENEIFYGGKNPEKIQDALVLIDIASGVSSIVGADAIFDGIGAYYAYSNGEYVQAAFYTTAAAVPFLSSAVRRAVMDGGEYVLKTMKGTYVTRPKNVLGMSYIFEVTDAFSHFTKTALNSKSFSRAAKYKTETKFLEALEDGMLADNSAIKALNDNPELVDEFNAFHKEGKGGLGEFLAKKQPELTWINNLTRTLGDGSNAKLTSWISEGLDASKLKIVFDNTNDKIGLYNRLQASKGLYHRKAIIGDYLSIPGVTQGKYISNSIDDISGNVAKNINGKQFTLYNGQVRSFQKTASLKLDNAIEVLEDLGNGIQLIKIKPRTKLYRVFDGYQPWDEITRTGNALPTGSYWTLTKPAKVEDVLVGSAVRPEWNSYSKLIEIEVPESGLIGWYGNTAKQPVSIDTGDFFLEGGSGQIVISFEQNGQNVSTIANSITPTSWTR